MDFYKFTYSSVAVPSLVFPLQWRSACTWSDHGCPLLFQAFSASLAVFQKRFASSRVLSTFTAFLTLEAPLVVIALGVVVLFGGEAVLGGVPFASRWYMWCRRPQGYLWSRRPQGRRELDI